MDISLKRKYRTNRTIMGHPAKARTGNANGISKHRRKNPKAPAQLQRVMIVDALTGHSHMETVL